MCSANTQGQTETHSNNSLLTGISNNGLNKEKPYVTAGDRSYIIGTMNGDFPDIGEHVPGEMGGIWMHPIKLLDGYYLNISDLSLKTKYWLSDAEEFINYPFGNTFKYNSHIQGLAVERKQFCPDGQPGVVIEYELSNSSDEVKDLNVEFLAKTDLSPVWFSKEIGIEDSDDKAVWLKHENCFVASDSLNNWYAVWGTSLTSTEQKVGINNSKSKSRGHGIACSSVYHITIDAHSNKKIVFVVAGSTKNSKKAIESYIYILKNYAKLLRAKKSLYSTIYNRAKISIPDTSLLQVYNWVKVNTQWLVRDVPGVGRGLSAGVMEYPWWFGCDNTYALQGVMETGDFQLAEETLRLLKNKSIQKNGNGRIPHEISTNGAVANAGNTQETAHFIICVEKLYRWTGNKQFLREMYPTIKKGLHWLLTDQDTNRNLFPEGYGIIEISGLNAELIDVAVYTQQALVAGSKIAGILNDKSASQKYKKLANELKDKINKDFWDDKASSYCDFYGTKDQAISAIRGNIRQLTQDGEAADKDKIKYFEDLGKRLSKTPDTTRGWIINKNWVINTPLETGIAPYDRAIRALDNIHDNNLGEYGPYLSAVYGKYMMTIATGVQAVSEYKYGRTDKCLFYVNDIVKTFSRVLPGSISEMMPDYGCFTQSWSNYGIVLPLISHIFGINPDASQKEIEITPHIPDSWSKDSLSLTALPVADNQISMSYQPVKNGEKYVIISKDTGWKIRFRLRPDNNVQYILNGRPIVPGDSGLIVLTKKENSIAILAKGL
ncbi:MAG: amylo-alpha-1,6-glucosidase [Ginsengibacter sp.]